MNDITKHNLGFALVIIGTVISCIGVIYNNIFLDHIAAMVIWCASNTLFSIYFYGRWKKWWDGGICDEIMCVLYLVMLVSGIWGLMHT